MKTKILLLATILAVTFACKKTVETYPESQYPSTPSGPLPANMATSVPLSVTLGWTASSDPQGDPVTYDVIMDTTSEFMTPIMVKANLYTNSCKIDSTLLQTEKTYFWKVTARDNHGNSSAGPPWRFTTQGIVYGSFTDPRDGKSYKTVKIGSQTWMAENLVYIPAHPIDYGYPLNDPANKQEYGILYRMNKAVFQEITPAGWHIPTDVEFDRLISTLGGSIEAGGKMKATGLQYWDAPNTGATNSSGFSARGTEYDMLNQYADFYATSATSTSNICYSYFLMYNSLSINRISMYYDHPVSYYYAVRCIKD
ncbi:MAG: FISUMP domain-containing protein [Bacteroidales bacterium]